jgi:hypothetical protein
LPLAQSTARGTVSITTPTKHPLIIITHNPPKGNWST